MEIVKSELIKKISMLEKVIPTKPQIPCMEGILVADGRMCTNDYQNAISISTPEADGECFIIPKKAIAMAKSLPDGMVSITYKSDDNSLLLKAGTIRTKISTFAPDAFPEISTIAEPTVNTMDFDELADMLNNTMYATSTNEARPIHTGVLLDGDGEKLNVVACDGYRLAWASTEYKEQIHMVIPKPTVKMLLSIKGAETVKIQSQGDKAVFTIGDCEIFSRLLSGSFLEYKRVFPARSKSTGVDRIRLYESMKRIMICSDDSNKGKVEIECTDKTMQLKCRGSAAEYTEELEVQDAFEQDLKIAFNSAFFLDALKSYDCSVIDCFFGTKNCDPLVMDDGSLKSMILPVRTATKE